MKKYSLLYILLLIPFYQILGQNFDYGNDWYKSDPNRQFVKIVVDEDGLYRTSSQDLLNEGYDLSSVNPNVPSFILSRKRSTNVCRNARRMHSNISSFMVREIMDKLIP